MNKNKNNRTMSVSKGCCVAAQRIREWMMSYALFLSADDFSPIQSERRMSGLGRACQAGCLLSSDFPDQIIQGASRSHKIDDNGAKMADPVDRDDVSFTIS